MYLENNMQLIIEFFKNFFQNVNEGFVELRPFQNGKPINSIFIPINEIECKIREEIYKLHNKNDIFFGVTVRETVNGGKKENCLFLPALYIDIDVGSEGHKKPSFFASKDEAITHLMDLGLDPSIVVDSGNGLHVYWLLDKPLKLDKESISKVEGVIKRIEVLCGGDTVHDVSRILRVPYTNNFKSTPVKTTKTVLADYSKKIDLDEFISKIGKNNLSEISDVLLNNSKVRKMIFNLWDEDVTDRSAFDQKIITALVKNGLSDEAISTVFNLFPTTGKYLERKLHDEVGADQYLSHSINNARKYLPPIVEIYSQTRNDDYKNSRYRIV
ncbi:MAG: hypothetical protein C0412_00005, partial [Flavobacterium sp.]|nr:hypothetical protein [Flavobacterium sp.]